MKPSQVNWQAAAVATFLHISKREQFKISNHPKLVTVKQKNG
jgi:hypothetical protein